MGGGEKVTQDKLRTAIGILGEMETLAIALFDIGDINLKQRINEAKENALNALYTPDKAFRGACVDKLMTYIRGDTL